MTDPQPQEKPPEQGKPNVPHGEPSEQPGRPLKIEPEKRPLVPALTPKSDKPTPG